MKTAKRPFIPPEDRYNQHAQKSAVSSSFIERALEQAGLDPKQYSVKILSGGFQNANYLLQGPSEKQVLRIYSTDLSTAQREVGVLEYLNQQSTKAPKVQGFFEFEGKAIALLEFLEGQLLQEQLEEAKIKDLQIFFLVGQLLARIHQIQLPRPGFIGPKMTVGQQYDNLGLFLRDFILRTLKAVPENRLEAPVRDRTLKLIEDHWSVVLDCEPTLSLVHCDFNPKNILVSKSGTPQVTGVLDWEFCLSGNGLLDVGNFFRFSEDYPDDAVDRFIEGYKSVRKLPENWREISLLLDLANMCSFLERPEDYQKTFHTARTVIKSTLDFFGYKE